MCILLSHVCMYRHISPRVCIAYTVWPCVDTPLAADINTVARISLGAPFRDQISRTTRDLSRCEYTRGYKARDFYEYIYMKIQIFVNRMFRLFARVRPDSAKVLIFSLLNRVRI